jgi:thiol-disulfide isomerase/thioredoxin
MQYYIKYAFFTAFFCICFLLVKGQAGGTKYKELQVEDKVPDYTLYNLVNYPSKKAKLSDFKGKPLLLDFWATWCTWCIASMPKIQELQNQFEGKIQVIMVNQGETLLKGTNFLSKREKLANLKLRVPIIYGDTILTNVLFNYGLSLPRIVWIDENGIIKHITLADEVNSKNISAFINNGKTEIDEKDKNVSSSLIDSLKRFTFNDSSRQSVANIKWQSSLYKEFQGLPRSPSAVPVLKTYVNGLSIIAALNQSVMDLYRFAFGDLHLYINSNYNYIDRVTITRTLLKCKDSTKYGMTVYNLTQSQELFSYQVIAPPFTSAQKLQEAMQSDLKRYFGFDAKKEKILMKCLVLTAFDTSLLLFKGGEFKQKFTDIELKLNEVRISYFIKSVESIIPNFGRYLLPPYPIIDETGFKGKLGDIDIETNVGDYIALDKALQRYGLRLKLEEREIEMLVIRESEESTLPFKNE